MIYYTGNFLLQLTLVPDSKCPLWSRSHNFLHTCWVIKYIAHRVPIKPIRYHNNLSNQFVLLQAKLIVVMFLSSTKMSLYVIIIFVSFITQCISFFVVVPTPNYILRLICLHLVLVLASYSYLPVPNLY